YRTSAARSTSAASERPSCKGRLTAARAAGYPACQVSLTAANDPFRTPADLPPQGSVVPGPGPRHVRPRRPGPSVLAAFRLRPGPVLRFRRRLPVRGAVAVVLRGHGRSGAEEADRPLPA